MSTFGNRKTCGIHIMNRLTFLCIYPQPLTRSFLHLAGDELEVNVDCENI